MQKKGLKITLPSTENTPLESGVAGTSTSGKGSKKQKGKAAVPVKKLKVEKTGTPVTKEPSKQKSGTPGITHELQASKLISGTLGDTPGKKTKSVMIIPPTQTLPSVPSRTLPSKVGSSSRRTSSTANAPEAVNTKSSLEQSVQPPTVNPNGHSGDGGSVVDSSKKNLQVVEYNSESGNEDDTFTKTKKRKVVAVLQKKTGFQPQHHVVESDQEAKDVKIVLDPKTKDQFKHEFDELRKWFPLGDKLVYASISQLTDPDATVVYRPCSILHVAEIQDSMIGSSETPQLAIVVPYELGPNGKKLFINILNRKDLKAFIKSGGKFMVISALHSMKSAKNIILSVGGNKDHDLSGRAHQLMKRHIKIVRGDTPENVLCKLYFLANAMNKTFAFETAYVEKIIHGRNQYKLLGAPDRAAKGMSNTKIYEPC
ncbi:hypothetical protein R1sor_015084 [Riccia sorocarpa]|uniref:Uncharacterized protein n=1 Tax=Riccia sorocarpa TaxID=122646 RepID=A0ABD3HF36_9MARC